MDYTEDPHDSPAGNTLDLDVSAKVQAASCDAAEAAQ